MVAPLEVSADLLRALLAVEPISIETPAGRGCQGLEDAGRAGEGRGRAGRQRQRRRGAQTIHARVLAVEPTATGGPVSILKSGYTIIGAFTEAGLWALVSISVILWITLRRFGDVLLTLVPLLLAGVVTLEICALIDLAAQLRQHHRAAAFARHRRGLQRSYYIMAWRAGQTNLLQSSLTRAVLFSALTTATAFGSLWFRAPGNRQHGRAPRPYRLSRPWRPGSCSSRC